MGCAGAAESARLIVGLLLQPAAGVAPQVQPSRLVIDEDGQAEGEGGQPPHESEIGRQAHRFSLVVRQLGGETSAKLHQ